jgi:tetraacyldisaccharide 4'-kinase
MAIASGAQALVLDDGHQNLALAYDLALVVVDGAVGFGNGRIIPAGPLRERVPNGLARTDLIIAMGAIQSEDVRVAAAQAAVPVTGASLIPVGAEGMAGLKALAFAGIGRPEKFFDTLRQAGVLLVGTQSFPDHHPYHAGELKALAARAQALGAMLITTQKDWVRLEQPWRIQVACLMISAQFEDDAVLDHALDRLFSGASMQA